MHTSRVGPGGIALPGLFFFQGRTAGDSTVMPFARVIR
jgi:hypothetical protein